MARETLASLRAKNEELEAQNKKYFDAWLKLDQERQKEVTESAQYKALKEHCERTLEVHSALQSDYKTLQAELQQAHTQCHTESHNARGAGRKPVLTVDQRQKILEFHAEGKSLRWIASQIGVTHTAIAKIIKKEIN